MLFEVIKKMYYFFYRCYFLFVSLYFGAAFPFGSIVWCFSKR